MIELRRWHASMEHMKNFIPVLVVALLVTGCGSQVPDLSWDDVYSMIEEGAYQSKIDQTIDDIGPETHPASVILIDYFNHCFAGGYERAWELIDRNSPFMTEKGDLTSFTTAWEQNENEYSNLSIDGLNIEEEIAGTRMIGVIFSIDIYDVSLRKTYTSSGQFEMSNISGEWRIFSSKPFH